MCVQVLKRERMARIQEGLHLHWGGEGRDKYPQKFSVYLVVEANFLSKKVIANFRKIYFVVVAKF